MVCHGAVNLLGVPPVGVFLLNSLETCTGLLLLAGLWTPITGTMAAAVELWKAFSQHGDLWIYILLGALGAALALLGPGCWSIDARLFGWKRIDLGDRKS
jgi:uncharacterized membrane protein YphA (DoxX/SURF4 family)